LEPGLKPNMKKKSNEKERKIGEIRIRIKCNRKI
jgi:hypothetical protein